jgi:regulator of replication initiation timing
LGNNNFKNSSGTHVNFYMVEEDEQLMIDNEKLREWSSKAKDIMKKQMISIIETSYDEFVQQFDVSEPYSAIKFARFIIKKLKE